MKFCRTEFAIAISFLLLFVASAAPAAPKVYIPIDSTSDTQDLTSSVAYSWQSLESKDFEQFQFTELKSDDLNVKYSDQALWLRLNLENPSDLPITKILSFTTFLVGEIDLIGPNHEVSQVTGSAIPLNQRSFQSRLPAFKLSFTPKEKRSVYFRRFSHHSLSTRIVLADTAVRVLVVDEDGYSLHDRPFERKSPTNPRREGGEQCGKYYTS